MQNGEPDPIALFEYLPAEQGSHFGGHHRLHHLHRGEEHAAALINAEDHVTIFLFAITAHMGAAGAQGHFPVQGANIIPLLIVAQLFKVEPTAAKA